MMIISLHRFTRVMFQINIKYPSDFPIISVIPENNIKYLFFIPNRSQWTARGRWRSLRRMQQAHPGQVPAECPGTRLARLLRPLLWMPPTAHRQMLQPRIEALLSQRFLQVSFWKGENIPCKSTNANSSVVLAKLSTVWLRS